MMMMKMMMMMMRIVLSLPLPLLFYSVNFISLTVDIFFLMNMSIYSCAD